MLNNPITNGTCSLKHLQDPVCSVGNLSYLRLIKLMASKKTSAGIVLYRVISGELEIFLVHPGGPFWAKRDQGSWSIPKGEIIEGAEPLETAKREFLEETGSPIDGVFTELTPLRQPGGKLILAWGVLGDIDASSVKSNTFAMEWPPRSGKQQHFPEVDRGAWFSVPEAAEKILAGQLGFLDELRQKIASPREIR
jgi:predicted NUDIX family NTP pyrophosphohydrolase